MEEQALIPLKGSSFVFWEMNKSLVGTRVTNDGIFISLFVCLFFFCGVEFK